MTTILTENFEKPLVSIIITSYNRANYIEDAIKSALAQDYANLEVIISDNCSTDNTDEIIGKYLSDPRVKFYRNDTNLGIIANFKIATEKRATGKFISYVSSDDYLVNNTFISTAIDIINKYENVLLVFGRIQRIQNDGTINSDITQHDFKDEFRPGREFFLESAGNNMPGWGAALIHRDELNKIDVFSSKGSSLDYEANLYMMLHGNIGFINAPTYFFRVHENQYSETIDLTTLTDNLSYIINPTNYAEQQNIFPPEKLTNFRNHMLFEESRRISLRLSVLDKAKYSEFMTFLKKNYNAVYVLLKKDVKWNILKFFYTHSALSLGILKFWNKDHYNFLKSLNRQRKAK